MQFRVDQSGRSRQSAFPRRRPQPLVHVQPYLIATLMSKGMPMLWQGEEFGENYFLPDFGAGRVATAARAAMGLLLRQPGSDAVNWSENCCASGGTVRRSAAALTFSSTTGTGTWREACCCSRATAGRNTRSSQSTRATPIKRCLSGFRSAATTSKNCRRSLNLNGIVALQETPLTIPSHYGRIWTAT